MHLTYPSTVQEYPLTLMFPDHQTFLKSWLSYHCKLTNHYSIAWSSLKVHIKQQPYELIVIAKVEKITVKLGNTTPEIFNVV